MLNKEVNNFEYVAALIGNKTTEGKGEEMSKIDDIIRDYVLRCTKGIFKGKFIYLNLTSEGETFGSDPEADLTMYIENAGLSPKHAEIKYNPKEKKYYLRDLGSESGTWIKVRNENPVLIYDNLMFRLDKYVFTFQHSYDSFDQLEEWLKRINLQKHAPVFRSHGIRTIKDLKELNENILRTSYNMSADDAEVIVRSIELIDVDFGELQAHKLKVISHTTNDIYEICWSGFLMGTAAHCNLHLPIEKGSKEPDKEVAIKYQYGTYWLVECSLHDISDAFFKLKENELYVLTPDDVINMGELDFNVQRFNTGVYEDIGSRPTMEDMVVIRHDLGVSYNKNVSFYAVFDGHGGTDCVKYIAENLVFCLRNNFLKGEEQFDNQPNIYDYLNQKLIDSICETDLMFFREHGEYSFNTGCTGVIILIVGDRVICANIGDSRAVLSRGGKPICLSVDHKPDQPDELKRIEEAGGYVNAKRVCGRLAISRAFGDFGYKAVSNSDIIKNHSKGRGKDLITVIPDIREFTLDYMQDEFIILGCDGLFDVFSNQRCVSFVRERLASMPLMEQDPQEVAIELTKKAIKESKELTKSSDNVSVIIICLTRGIVETFDKTIIQSCDAINIYDTMPNISHSPNQRKVIHQRKIVKRSGTLGYGFVLIVS